MNLKTDILWELAVKRIRRRKVGISEGMYLLSLDALNQ